jgi:hypothetical protein
MADEGDMKFMLEFFNMVNAFGTDPVLSDILTEENARHISYLKDCVAYLGDVDFELIDDENYEYIMSYLQEADAWSNDFIRGVTLGILAGIDTDANNPMGFKHEMATLYRLLNAILIERRFA